MIRLYLAAPVLVLTFCQLTDPIQQKPISAATCNVAAFLIERSEIATALVSSPGSEIIRRLPRLNDPEYEKGVYLKIRNSQSGWLQLESVERPGDGSDDPAFRGLWISATMVGVQVADYDPYSEGKPLYAQPNLSAEVTGKASPVSVVPVLDCKDKWIYTRTIDVQSNQVDGWLSPEDQCPNMVSSCS